MLLVSLCSAPSAADDQAYGDAVAPVVEITAEHRRAVDEGLAWLARHQDEDGSWSAKIGYKLHSNYHTTGEDGHVGVTALAGMCFLAGGHLPGRGEYGAAVEHCLSFVLSACQEDGYVTRNGTRMYSHAFATLFLAEIYGTTHRQDVREKLQLAVDFIVNTQNAKGGWRYAPFSAESDMSIVVCQVLALRAARNIGIRVPRATVDRAARYVVDSAVTEDPRVHFHRRAFEVERGSFVYQRQRDTRSSFPLTAAGITALHGVGIYSDQSIQRGLDYLRRHLDAFNQMHGRADGGHYFFWYGHYYAVQAMYTAGSTSHATYWEPYFAEARREILSMQNPEGSFPNRVGPGEAFGTAMAVLILEIPYRYLPIFQR